MASTGAASSGAGPGAGAGNSLKMKAFNIMVKKPLSKKEMEKQKKEREEQEAAEAYQEFVETFEQPSSKGKMFVKGSVINPGSGEEEATRSVYKPTKLQELEEKAKKSQKQDNFRHHSVSSSSKAPPEKPGKKKEKEKKKSNLELFKEELKSIQEEREERHRLKTILKKEGVKEVDAGHDLIPAADEYRYPGYGSYDTGDPNTTNIYLGNINPKMTEQQLMETFGKYGPLASVKIMWPRSEEERARNRNCGFVAFMNRKDGERALRNLNAREVMGYEMKLGWGKAVPIPPHPVYIPAKLMELTMPPPPSGLPFNAQPDKKDVDKIPGHGTPWPVTPQEKENFSRIIQNSVVKVVIPTDRNLLCLIHRMTEFVVREGPMFEAMIMNRELSNPMFRFLFDNQSPAHVYYRWRLYSVLQGEHPSKWRTEEFRLFKGGSNWKPPPLNPFLQGMPEDLVEGSPERADRDSHRKSSKSKMKDKEHHRGFKETKDSDSSKKGTLSDTNREKLEDMLRNLTPDRSRLADGMIYCIDHADAADEIADCIAESLSIPETALHKKIARLYLISDILHNCGVRVTNASHYRKSFQARLIAIFHDVRDCFFSIDGRLKAEQFKQRVMNCFRAWEDWALYSGDFLVKLQNIFLGLIPREPEIKPIESDDVDGVPLEEEGEADVDGVPIDDVDGQPMADDGVSALKFKPSKWETIDPETVEAQAMTTSKWEQLEPQKEEEEDVDGKPMSSPNLTGTSPGDDSIGSAFLEQLKMELNEERRAKLREIEVKVLKFQDELESGRRRKKSDTSLTDQVEEYRKKLIRKEIKQAEEMERRERRSQSRSRSTSPKGHESPRQSSYSNRRKRSRSRSRSRSPCSRTERRKSPSGKHQRKQRSRSPSERRRPRSPTQRSKRR